MKLEQELLEQIKSNIEFAKTYLGARVSFRTLASRSCEGYPAKIVGYSESGSIIIGFPYKRRMPAVTWTFIESVDHVYIKGRFHGFMYCQQSNLELLGDEEQETIRMNRKADKNTERYSVGECIKSMYAFDVATYNNGEVFGAYIKGEDGSMRLSACGSGVKDLHSKLFNYEVY